MMPRTEEFFEIIESEEQARRAISGRAVLAYMADWCHPCRAMLSEIERNYPRIRRELQRCDVSLGYVDRDNPNLRHFIKQQKIFSLPTFIAYKGGRQIGEFIGLRLGRELEQLVSRFGSSARGQPEQKAY